MTIGEFNELYTNGVIYPYGNNRGKSKQKLNKTLVNRYATSWDTASSGAATLEATNKGYMLRDFHSRAEAIKRGIAAGNIDPKDHILVRIIPPGDGLRAYKNINSARAHSTVEKLSNTDLAFGAEIQKVLDRSKGFKEIEFPNKFYIQIAHSIIDLKIKRRGDFVFVRNHSHEVRRFRDSPHEAVKELHLSDAQAQGIARAADFYCLVRNVSLSESPNSKTVARILGSATFFGYVLFDHLFKRKLKDPAHVGKAIVLHQRKVEDLVMNLSKGGIESRVEVSNMLLTFLNK